MEENKENEKTFMSGASSTKKKVNMTSSPQQKRNQK
jgi:hypothetical protein